MRWISSVKNGKTMIHAYDKSYLGDVMSNMGAMLDYAVGLCGENLELFWARFLISGVAEQFSRRNPRYLCGLSGTELALAVARKTGSPLPDKDPLIDIGSREYWTGWTLAYLQWYLNMPFEEMQQKGLGARELYEVYSPLHEADLMRSVSFAETRLKENSCKNNLKTLRKNAGLTQKQLSDATGISLRAVRAYEQGQLSLAKASAESIRNLNSVLGLQQ